MATTIKFLRGTTLNTNYTIGSFASAAEPWFISGSGLNQLYVDGIPINPHLKVGTGLSVTETLGAVGALESYNTVAFDLSTYSATGMGNALELITSGTAGEIGLFAGYNFYVGEENDTSSASSVSDDNVYLHIRSNNGNNHKKIKIVSGTGATVTAANDIITVSATGVGVTLYDLIFQNYGIGTGVLYDAETSGYTISANGGLAFKQVGLVTTIEDTKTIAVGNAYTDTTNETFSGNAFINLIGDVDSSGTKGTYGYFGLAEGNGISLSTTGGIITLASTVTDTHYTSKNIVAGTNSATTQATVASNGVYLNHLEQTTLSSSTYIIGSNGIKVFSDVAGKINIRGTRIVVSNSATGITDGTSFSGPVYINLVGDNDGDDTLEVLDSVKLVGAGAAALAVGATAKEITITGTDTNTTYDLSTNSNGPDHFEGYIAISGSDKIELKHVDQVAGVGSMMTFTDNGGNTGLNIAITIIDGGTF